MVRRKATRVLPRNKPQKPDITFIEENEADAESKRESLKKKLEDYDKQVEDMVKKMELEKKSVIECIKSLYYIDEQRTHPSVNNMLWTAFLQQNSLGCPESPIRESITQLVNVVEETSTLKKKKKGTKTVEDTPVANLHGTTRSLRSRKNSKVEVNDQGNNLEMTVKTSSRSKKPKDILTPLNQRIPKCPSSLLITPKFDPRTPLPMSTLRKPRLGEIAVSLKGSPLQVDAREYKMENVLSSDLDNKTKEELQLLHEKVAKLLEK